MDGHAWQRLAAGWWTCISCGARTKAPPDLRGSCRGVDAPAAPSPAAPPTAAPARPAREVAHELICQARGETWCRDFFDGQGSPKPGENYDGYHGAQCDDFTAQLAERDRASRSPGQAAAAWPDRPACGCDVGEAAECGGPGNPSELCACKCHSSAGLEGRLRPGSDEGAAGKVHGAPLSGLDAATVEAAAKVVADMRDDVDTAQWRRCVNTAAARIRALATPPGQTKP